MCISNLINQYQSSFINKRNWRGVYIYIYLYFKWQIPVWCALCLKSARSCSWNRTSLNQRKSREREREGGFTLPSKRCSASFQKHRCKNYGIPCDWFIYCLKSNTLLSKYICSFPCIGLHPLFKETLFEHKIQHAGCMQHSCRKRRCSLEKCIIPCW